MDIDDFRVAVVTEKGNFVYFAHNSFNGYKHFIWMRVPQYNSKVNKHFIWMRVSDYLDLFC